VARDAKKRADEHIHPAPRRFALGRVFPVRELFLARREARIPGTRRLGGLFKKLASVVWLVLVIFFFFLVVFCARRAVWGVCSPPGGGKGGGILGGGGAQKKKRGPFSRPSV